MNLVTSPIPPDGIPVELATWLTRLVDDLGRGPPRWLQDTQRLSLWQTSSPSRDGWQPHWLHAKTRYTMLPVQLALVSDVNVDPSASVYTEFDLQDATARRSLLPKGRTFTTNTGFRANSPKVLYEIEPRSPAREIRGLDPVVPVDHSVTLEWRNRDNTPQALEAGRVLSVMLTEVFAQIVWVAMS